jgi:hypothetical protein
MSNTPKAPVLTYVRANELFRYDPLTGLICWRVGRPGLRAGTVAGTLSNGYVQIEADGRFYRGHRIAWLLQTGKWPRHQVDHKNRIRNDNRWVNLRAATPLQNARNRSVCSRNKSGVLGVYPLGNKWAAHIGVDGKTLHLGRFDDKAAAAAARRDAERQHYGSFAGSAEPCCELLQFATPISERRAA